MIRWPRILILLAIGAGCVVGVSWMLVVDSPAQTAPANDKATDGYPMDAVALEREVRSSLPMGSSLAAVEDYLTKRGLEFSFDARLKTVFAIARKLQGSASLARKSLAFKFHFDDALALKSIDAEVLHTGP